MPKSPSNPRYRLRAGRLAVLGAAGVVIAAAIATAGTAPVAQAVPVTVDPLAAALGFNAFVEGETILVSAESEGGIATGGNLVVSGSYNVNIHDASTFTAPGDSVPSALVVGGQVDFTQDPANSVVQVHDYLKVGDLTGADALNTDSNNASVNTRLVVDGSDYNSTPRIPTTPISPPPTSKARSSRRTRASGRSAQTAAKSTTSLSRLRSPAGRMSLQRSRRRTTTGPGLTIRPMATTAMATATRRRM